MKTIYSLQEFRGQLLEIAKIKGEDYTNVEVRADHDGKITFNAYINGCGSWFRADTMEDCITHFKEQITQPPIKNIDVEIEIPEQVEVTEPANEAVVSTPTDDLPF